MSDMTPERAERLAAKYGIHSGPGYGVQDVTPQQAVATAWAEQVERAIREVRAACEEYNGEELDWLLWELPTELRQRVEQARERVREGQRRGIIHFYDDRNKYDERNGWPAFDPDNPDHATVPLGTVLVDPDTVHVLRGGTEPLFDRRDGLGRFQRPADVPAVDDELPDFGHAYDFATFMRSAERTYLFGFCDLRLSTGCGGSTNGVAVKQRLLAVPLGQHVYVLGVCAGCLDALAESWRRDHPSKTVGTVRKRRRRSS